VWHGLGRQYLSLTLIDGASLHHCQSFAVSGTNCCVIFTICFLEEFYFSYNLLTLLATRISTIWANFMFFIVHCNCKPVLQCQTSADSWSVHKQFTPLLGITFIYIHANNSHWFPNIYLCFHASFNYLYTNLWSVSVR